LEASCHVGTVDGLAVMNDPVNVCPSIIIAKKMKVLNVYFFKHAGFDEPESKMRIDIFIREVFK